MHAGTVVAQRILQPVLDLPLILRAFHVDEVDDDEAAQIAQPQLAGDFIGRFEIGVERRRLNVAGLRRPCRVDVDRDERLGVVDDDGAACRQCHLAGIGGFDLVLDLEPREQRHVVLVQLHAVHRRRHHMAHELLRLLEDRFGIDQQFADVGMKVVADRANDETRLLIDQKRAGLAFRGAIDRLPELQEVVEVPLQFFERASYAGGTGDDAHPVRHFQLPDRVAQFVAIFTFDTTRDATSARIVGHQHQVAPGERDVRGEGSALVAAFVLVDLDDEFLPVLELILDAAATAVTFAQILAGDFLERQEPVTVGAVIDETGFEAGFDAGDDCLVDVALALFLTGRFDIEIDQLLAVDDGYPKLFGLGGVEQHAFH